MAHYIGTLKRLKNNRMIINLPTEKKFFVIDDGMQMSERKLYKVNADIINGEFKFNGIESLVNDMSDEIFEKTWNDYNTTIDLADLEEDIEVAVTEDMPVFNVAGTDPNDITPAQKTPTFEIAEGVPVEELALMAPPPQEMTLASFEEIDRFYATYEYIKKKIINKSDYQIFTQGGEKRAFLKKSGFRKFVDAFRLSVEMIKRSFIDYKHGNKTGIECEVWVKVSTLNGNFIEAVAICQQYEKGRNRSKHDVFTTAYTRAVNRGVSDLVAFGEVSAEEIA